MPYEKTIQVLQGGSVLAECGPMRLMISASIGRIPQPRACVRAAEESFLFLERIARLRQVLGQEYRKEERWLDEPLALSMVESIRAVGDEDLTPMAAVAGTISDAVADFLSDRGMTRVVVDNGGDIAIRLAQGESVRVGIRPDVGDPGLSHVIALGGHRPSWGVATSGLGGRSLSRGVASAVTIVGGSASIADAAATCVANASYVEDEHVVRKPAREIDPHTDIPELPVTVNVGPLSEEKKALALAGAFGRAEELVERNVILGALVVVQGSTVMTRFMKEALAG